MEKWNFIYKSYCKVGNWDQLCATYLFHTPIPSCYSLHSIDSTHKIYYIHLSVNHKRFRPLHAFPSIIFITFVSIHFITFHLIHYMRFFHSFHFLRIYFPHISLIPSIPFIVTSYMNVASMTTPASVGVGEGNHC